MNCNLFSDFVGWHIDCRTCTVWGTQLEARIQLKFVLQSFIVVMTQNYIYIYICVCVCVCVCVVCVCGWVGGWVGRVAPSV